MSNLKKAHLASLLDILKEFDDITDDEYDQTKKMLASEADMCMAELVIRYKATHDQDSTTDKGRERAEEPIAACNT